MRATLVHLPAVFTHDVDSHRKEPNVDLQESEGVREEGGGSEGGGRREEGVRLPIRPQ